MNKQTEALKMAIEYIKNQEIHLSFDNLRAKQHTLQACIEALEQPAQEPVAVCVVMPFRGNEARRRFDIVWKNGQPIEGNLYTHPAPSWQGLSDAVVMEIVWDLEHITDKDLFIVEFYRAIEQALKEKNYG